ncbi:MAG: cytidylate kinase family protein [Acidimicrobiales bacterium]
MAHDHLDAETARMRQRESDRAREPYARHLYGTEMSDPSHFHLVIDTTAIGIDACVDLLATWVRRPATCRRLPPHVAGLTGVCTDGPQTELHSNYRKEAT